jgi:flagellar hook-basal body complex protein FliE
VSVAVSKANTAFKHDDEINTFLLLQLGKFQTEVKNTLTKAHNKLNKIGSDAAKKYDRAREDDKSVLLGLFLKLKEAEVRRGFCPP